MACYVASCQNLSAKKCGYFSSKTDIFIFQCLDGMQKMETSKIGYVSLLFYLKCDEAVWMCSRCVLAHSNCSVMIKL